MRFGIKSITMDEVARHCNISKKTIYQYFNDKDALVKEIMERHIEQDRCVIQNLHDQASSALDEVVKISEYLKTEIAGIHPSVLYDLRKYHSSAYEVFENHRDNHFLGLVTRNLERGVKEGVYRSEINIGIYARLRILQLEALFDGKLFPKTEWEQTSVQLYFIDHFVRGLATEEGLKQWLNISQNPFKVIR